MIEATAPKKEAFAAESGHWYAADGSPAYEQPYADPKKGMRATTLRDAKKLGLYPSVTSITSLAARPGLEKWKADQLLMAALTMPRPIGSSSDDFVKLIYEDAKAQAEAARDKGTKIHADLDLAFGGEMFDTDFATEIQAVMVMLRDNFPRTRWTTKRTFASMRGYGGALDLYGESMDDDGRTVVIDFKTTAFTEKDISGSRGLAYDEHIMQGAAYSVGMRGDFYADIANLFISTSVPGLVYLHRWKPEEIVRGWEMFDALLAFWKASRGYVPGATNARD